MYSKLLRFAVNQRRATYIENIPIHTLRYKDLTKKFQQYQLAKTNPLIMEKNNQKQHT